jgi:hypothetical protein
MSESSSGLYDFYPNASNGFPNLGDGDGFILENVANLQNNSQTQQQNNFLTLALAGIGVLGLFLILRKD